MDGPLFVEDDSSPYPTKKLPTGVRTIIYSFCTLIEIINKISKLSRTDRHLLLMHSQLLNQRRDLLLKLDSSDDDSKTLSSIDTSLQMATSPMKEDVAYKEHATRPILPTPPQVTIANI